MTVSNMIATRYRNAVNNGVTPANIAIAPDTVDRIADEQGLARGQLLKVCGCYIQLQSEMNFGLGVFF